jgi:phosphohistidine swiveling domain-containing protein
MDNWISLGIRPESLLAKYLKILAWSEGLKKELGVGYTKFTASSDGSQSVLEDEDQKILEEIRQIPLNLNYLEKTERIDQEVSNLLQNDSPDFLKIFQLLVDQLTYFYLAKEQTELIFLNSQTSSETKQKIEEWRNSDSLFSSSELAFKKLAEFLKIPQENLELMTLEEVKEGLQGKLVQVNQRKNEWGLILENQQIKVQNSIINPIENPTNLNEIRGRSVLETAEIIKGIVGKDILVVSATTPKMVPEIRKMKAVVADEGGQLSHAAITCREFKIPGIIGTKVATKFLKTGDQIEIDTSKGIVKVVN